MKANDLFQRTSTLAFSTVGIIAAGRHRLDRDASPVYVERYQLILLYLPRTRSLSLPGTSDRRRRMPQN